MGWLSKLFGSDGGGRSAKPENFEQWFEQYAALGFERQQQFLEETADAGEAEVDLGRGRLRFADGSEYGVCILPDGKEVEEWAYYRANNGGNNK